MSTRDEVSNDAPAIKDPRTPWGAPFAQPAPPEPRALTDPAQLLRAVGDRAAEEHERIRQQEQRRREALTLKQEEMSLEVQRQELQRQQQARRDESYQQQAFYLDSRRRSLGLRAALRDAGWCCVGFAATAVVVAVVTSRPRKPAEQERTQ